MELLKFSLLSIFSIAALIASTQAVSCFVGTATPGIMLLPNSTCTSGNCKTVNGSGVYPTYSCGDAGVANSCNATTGAMACYCNTDFCNMPMYTKSGSEMNQLNHLIVLLMPFVFAFFNLAKF